jgi:hypothetical protein
MDINLNLPTLPTQDEKDAMDGANSPSTLNVFSTANDLPTKTSDLTNDGDDGNPFISLNDLPSNLILYATNVASDIPTYVKLVSSITDPSYNTVAVDVSTSSITTTNQFISALITLPNLIVGNPGVLNITTIGNIRRTAGTGNAEFYFEVYKRTIGGVETLITTSGNTIPVINTGYAEFSATALWNDGIFLATDRIVLKFYGSRIAGGSNPTYDFQFGGSTPVRSLVPIPLTVTPFITLDEVADVTITTPVNNDLLAYESSTSLWKNKTASTLGIAELASPTFTTDITTPLIIGGTAVGSNISYKSTSGTGTASGIAHQFIGGTNGATVLSSQYNDGQFLIGTTTRNTTALGVVRIGQGTSVVDIGEVASSVSAIWLNASTPSVTNYAIKGGSTNTSINVLSGNVSLGVANAGKFFITATALSTAFSATTSGVVAPFTFTHPANTNQTLSTESIGVDFNLSATVQHATGALATQRAFVIKAPTYSFVGASTITTAATLAISAAPIAGTNGTITNAYALWVQGGKSLFAGNIELTQTVTTEVLVSNRTVTIVINGTTYKLLAVV